jgi:DNA uptake protein ComE-like DNA-binding protein
MKSRNEKRNSVFITASAVCIIFIWVSALFGISDKGYELDICQKINPNKAEISSLRRLPQVGVGKALMIEKFRREGKGQGEPVFTSAEDLRAVKGIGSKTIKNIEKILVFE